MEQANLGHRFRDVMATTPLIPVILCGGTGTRLWPLSRASYPKQYWPLSGDGDATLLQQTQQRLTGLEALGAPLLLSLIDSSEPTRPERISYAVF